MPERYGPWKTAHERLRRWTADGTWDRIFDLVVMKDDAVGNVEWVFSIDSSSVRAHQHAAGARKKGDAQPAGSRPSRRRAGPGRPRSRPQRVIADKAYSHPSTRRALRARGIAFTCPERSDQVAYRKTKGPAGGRPPAFDKTIYRDRNVVERCFGRLKQFRALATRYAKRVAYYRAQVVIAATALWLRHLQDTP
jgi:transposase